MFEQQKSTDNNKSIMWVAAKEAMAAGEQAHILCYIYTRRFSYELNK